MKKTIFYLPILFLSAFMIISSCTEDTFTLDVPEESLTEQSSRIVVTPTGLDDTENLLEAFEKVTGSCENSKVILTGGRYYIKPIFVENFNGIFKGEGLERTVIYPLVNTYDLGGWTIIKSSPIETSQDYLITFVGGEVAVLGIDFKMED